jgi:hypothetical protein
MSKRFLVDLRWMRAGAELRVVDPGRFATVLDAAEGIVSAYRNARMWAPEPVTARNDNR